MKRAMMILAVLAVAVLSYAAGVATKPATEPAYKFPWVPEDEIKAMHRISEITELERRCLTNAINQRIVILPGVAVSELRAKPEPGRMHVIARIVPVKDTWPQGLGTKDGLKTVVAGIEQACRGRFCNIARVERPKSGQPWRVLIQVYAGKQLVVQKRDDALTFNKSVSK